MALPLFSRVLPHAEGANVDLALRLQITWLMRIGLNLPPLALAALVNWIESSRGLVEKENIRIERYGTGNPSPFSHFSANL